jgi:hypothetical protein
MENENDSTKIVHFGATQQMEDVLQCWEIISYNETNNNSSRRDNKFELDDPALRDIKISLICVTDT